MRSDLPPQSLSGVFLKAGDAFRRLRAAHCARRGHVPPTPTATFARWRRCHGRKRDTQATGVAQTWRGELGFGVRSVCHCSGGARSQTASIFAQQVSGFLRHRRGTHARENQRVTDIFRSLMRWKFFNFDISIPFRPAHWRFFGMTRWAHSDGSTGRCCGTCTSIRSELCLLDVRASWGRKGVAGVHRLGYHPSRERCGTFQKLNREQKIVPDPVWGVLEGLNGWRVAECGFTIARGALLVMLEIQPSKQVHRFGLITLEKPGGSAQAVRRLHRLMKARSNKCRRRTSMKAYRGLHVCNYGAKTCGVDPICKRMSRS